MSPNRLAFIVAMSLCSLTACSRAKTPNIILITVDTLRADRLGCYGYEPARTPNIDRLATEGIRVAYAIAPTPLTLPSHASILTGLEPPAHGVRDNGTFRVPDAAQTLAERLKTEGYQTQAFVSAEVLHRRFNLNQGFDGYDDELWGEGTPADFMFRRTSQGGRASKTVRSQAGAWERATNEKRETQKAGSPWRSNAGNPLFEHLELSGKVVFFGPQGALEEAGQKCQQAAIAVTIGSLGEPDEVNHQRSGEQRVAALPG